MTPRPGTAAAKLDLSKLKVELVTPSKRRELRFQPTAATRGGRMPDGIVEEVPLTDEAPGDHSSRRDGVIAGPIAGSDATHHHRSATAAHGSASRVECDGCRGHWTANKGGVSSFSRTSAPVADRATPVYAPLRAGKASPEDDSPFADAVNAIIRGSDPRRLNELFGSRRRIRVTWSFLATNLTSRRKVPVHKGSDPGPTAVGVVIGQGEKLNSEITVTFPEQPANAVFELVATARMRDTFGLVGTVRHRVSSHLLTHSDTRDLARRWCERPRPWLRLRRTSLI